MFRRSILLVLLVAACTNAGSGSEAIGTTRLSSTPAPGEPDTTTREVIPQAGGG